jgi:hypothetical protein
MTTDHRQLILRRINTIYNFTGDDDLEVLNRGVMDVAKLLIDRLDAKYLNALEVGLGPCGCVDVVLTHKSIYLTLDDETIEIWWLPVEGRPAGGRTTLEHQATVEATVDLITTTILGLECS